MCGIAGFVSKAPLGPEASGIGARLLREMAHRGPDGEGVYKGGHIWMGMRRLSIIDPRGGWQPLYNEDRSLALIANGEIYNFIELRDNLIARGHLFRTGSDCETIVHLFEEHGENCVDYLRGMFAFAIWDIRQKRLFLARDRLGEKPLYVYTRSDCLFFSSEMKPLLASGVAPFCIDPPSLNLHLHYGYVPEPRTMVKNVTKLPAGHTITIDALTWKLVQKRYWAMTDSPPITGDPVSIVDEQLHQIGRLIIRSDVPVGVALSGGLDSSLVAALAARYSPQTLQTFTVGYEGNVESDERNDAKRFAEYLGMPWHNITLSTSEVVEGFPGLVARTDDPIGDIAGYGYFAVMRAARESGIPVMLQGQGGDELFWGYSWVREAAARSHLKALALRDGWGALAEYWRAEKPANWNFRNLRRYAKKGFGLVPAISKLRADLDSPAEELVFYNINNEFAAATNISRKIYSESYFADLPHRHASRLFTGPQHWEDTGVSLTSLICNTYLLENGLAQGDRLSMASSVELRLPLVDYQLVEKVIGLRKSFPDHSAQPKRILREVASRILPEWVMQRKKRGFSPPVDQWLSGIHAKYGKDLQDGLLVSESLLDKKVISKMSQNPPCRGSERNVWFSLVVLETWMRSMKNLVPKYP